MAPTKKPTTRKTDSPKTTANLDALSAEVTTEAEPFSFTFKGKRFVTQNPYDLDFEEGMAAEQKGLREQLATFLGPANDEFLELKPTMKNVIALVQAAEKYYGEHFGNPGEDGGSQTS